MSLQATRWAWFNEKKKSVFELEVERRKESFSVPLSQHFPQHYYLSTWEVTNLGIVLCMYA